MNYNSAKDANKRQSQISALSQAARAPKSLLTGELGSKKIRPFRRNAPGRRGLRGELLREENGAEERRAPGREKLRGQESSREREAPGREDLLGEKSSEETKAPESYLLGDLVSRKVMSSLHPPG
jgi:hypothetical protein